MIPAMGRLARLVIPDLPYHVTQRGNRRQQTFFCEEDYAVYLELMAEWCAERGVEVGALGREPRLRLELVRVFGGERPA